VLDCDPREERHLGSNPHERHGPPLAHNCVRRKRHSEEGKRLLSRRRKAAEQRHGEKERRVTATAATHAAHEKNNQQVATLLRPVVLEVVLSGKVLLARPARQPTADSTRHEREHKNNHNELEELGVQMKSVTGRKVAAIGQQVALAPAGTCLLGLRLFSWSFAKQPMLSTRRRRADVSAGRRADVSATRT